MTSGPRGMPDSAWIFDFDNQAVLREHADSALASEQVE